MAGSARSPGRSPPAPTCFSPCSGNTRCLYLHCALWAWVEIWGFWPKEAKKRNKGKSCSLPPFAHLTRPQFKGGSCPIHPHQPLTCLLTARLPTRRGLAGALAFPSRPSGYLVSELRRDRAEPHRVAGGCLGRLGPAGSDLSPHAPRVCFEM